MNPNNNNHNHHHHNRNQHPSGNNFSSSNSKLHSHRPQSSASHNYTNNATYNNNHGQYSSSSVSMQIPKKNKARNSLLANNVNTDNFNSNMKQSMAFDSNAPIPKKSRPLSASKHTNSRIKIKSEARPFVLSINTKGMHLNFPKRKSSSISSLSTPPSSKNSSKTGLRSSGRTVKRKSYIDDLKETDSDFLDTDEEDGGTKDHSQQPAKKKSRLRKVSDKTPKHTSSIDDVNMSSTPSSSVLHLKKPSSSSVSQQKKQKKQGQNSNPNKFSGIVGMGGGTMAHQGGDTLVPPDQVEGPPPGVLPSLYYSRECLLHVWVIEKIIGWKSRHVVTLESFEDEKDKNVDIKEETVEKATTSSENVEMKPKEESTESKANSQPKIEAGVNETPSSGDVEMKTNEEASLITTETKKIKEPLLDLNQALAISDKLVTDNITDRRKRMDISRINTIECPTVVHAHTQKEIQRAKKSGTKPKFGIKTHTEKEDVLLIKWRGRSHLHCSWERIADLEKFDPSNNTAKGKIKRYYQSQHMLLGENWKHVLEEGRKLAVHGPLGVKTQSEMSESTEGEEEDFFQADCVEVERIVACDENQMDMKVLAKQRALNIKAEKEATAKRQQELIPTEMKGNDGGGTESDKNGAEDEIEEPWDPEDNVRYIVKWKGLQYSEITWEYWRHIKHDSVNQAEDFWHRQKPPNIEKLKNASHPHMRDYKKLATSPLFGLSTVKRPVGDLEDNNTRSKNSNDDDDQSSGLRLRPYQLEGVNWLLWNWWNKRSCILADEMGLGKTIQSMTFLDQLTKLPKAQVRGPYLVVAPLTLVNQWQSESETWAPDMNVLLYHASQDARAFLAKEEFYYTSQFMSKKTASELKRKHITKFHILITTYEVVMKDKEVLSKIRWKALIVDEAHRLKNDQSRLFADLAAVPRDFCLLLTGTPLQNSTEELWSLLNFSDNSAFASKEEFVEKFGQLSDSKQVSDLHSVLKPYLLRRVKEDVEKSLPPKVETILEVTLTPIQKTYYKAIYEKNTTFLFKGSKSSNAPSLMNVMMELRKCCNHPFLIKGAEERIMAEAATKIKDDGSDDPVLKWQKLLRDQLVQSSGKMVLLMKLLPKLQSGGHKVLIFSQMVRVLDLLEELLRLNKYSYERLDGSTGASSRAAAVERFNKKSYQRFVMLLSTRAGGLGLNLTSADTVVIFDSDWNPQNDLQAMARAHRIGQTRAVSVYRLLTAKTYEMHMFHSASMKLGLDRAVLAHQRQQEGEEQDTSKKAKSKTPFQANEIDELLKKGAYDVFRDEDDSEAQKFMDTDIDQLLERSSRTVTYGNTDTSMSSGLGSFSKASFVTADADGKDIDLDDPNFWEKAVGLDVPIESSADDGLLLQGEKRNRKQVQVFDPYAAFHEAEQKKKDKIALKVKEEKEEKRRLKQEKKQKKLEEKERKKKERAAKSSKSTEQPPPKIKEPNNDTIIKEKKYKEPKLKRLKRSEHRRALRNSQQEDSVFYRMKQGWEPNQRDRAIAGILLFGFGRFCKIRNESNLISLPIQDIEVFLRGYMYQLGIQASHLLLSSMASGKKSGDKLDLGIDVDTVDGEWVVNAIFSAMKYHELLHNQERDLRIAQILNERSFTANLRPGIALLSLQSLALLTRLNQVVEKALDQALSDLGQEELGKRGCPTKDLSTLDIDLKARHVTNEELSHSIGRHLEGKWKVDRLSAWSPASWWDRSCDLALLIGTFTHGLHRYQAMQNDEDLPFLDKISSHSKKYLTCTKSYQNFVTLTTAARHVFDRALAVCQEKHALAMRPGAEYFNLTKPNESSSNKIEDAASKESGIITLPCLAHSIQEAVMKKICDLPAPANTSNDSKDNATERLPMPDSRCLNIRLREVIDIIENVDLFEGELCSTSIKKDSICKNHQVAKRLQVSLGLYGSPHHSNTNALETNRNVLEGTSNYLFGAASENLATISTTHDSLKYQRAPGVPSILTRYGLIALFYADIDAVKKVLAYEEKLIAAQKTALAYEERLNAAPILNKKKAKKEKEDETDSEKHLQIHYDLKNIPSSFIDDSLQRSALLASLLCCGFCLPLESPLPAEPTSDILGLSNNSSFEFFKVKDLLETANYMAGTEITFSEEGVTHYIADVLIPHCIRTCLRSKDFTVYPDEREKIPLPDPFEKIQNHSVCAVEHSSALLRRIKLATAIRIIIGGQVLSASDILEVLKSSRMRNNTDGVPTWWCPWIHDLELLMHAARFGLFSILHHKSSNVEDRKLDVEMQNADSNDINDNFGSKNHLQDPLEKSSFQGMELEKHIRTVFLGSNEERTSSRGLLPKSVIETASAGELQNFINRQKAEFPSLYVIERRLSFICGDLSSLYMKRLHEVSPQENEGEKENPIVDETKEFAFPSWVYVDVPMFDHGGWPRTH